MANLPPIIFIIGGPGSGKGTICDKLKAKYNLTHLSTGDLLRDEVASGSEKGKALNEIMKAGKLVSNGQVLDLLQAAIKKNPQAKGFLIDGYPREASQASEFEKQIAPPNAVLYFKCSDKVMTTRLLDRGKSSGRIDDNAETIQKRLDTFHANTQPILDFFTPTNKLFTLNGEESVEAVFAQVDQTLAPILAK